MNVSFYDEVNKRIDETHTYKLRKVPIYDGRLYEQPCSDEDVIKILEFRGTGEKRKFMDVLREFVIRDLRSIENFIDDNYPTEEHLWLYDYIASKNYQLEFEKDDIMLRHPSKAL